MARIDRSSPGERIGPPKVQSHLQVRDDLAR
jgi:hypothetical protein